MYSNMASDGNAQAFQENKTSGLTYKLKLKIKF